MAKPKKTSTDDSDPGKRPPSRENTRYVALPINLYQALKDYADEHSTEDDKRSVSWAARVAVRKFLTEEGQKIPPLPKGEKD